MIVKDPADMEHGYEGPGVQGVESRRTRAVRESRRRWLIASANVAAVLLLCVTLYQAAYHLSGAATETERSAAKQSIAEMGQLLATEVQHIATAAGARGRMISRKPALIAALQTGDRAALTTVCNDAIRNATEIDVVAVFDAAGKILAMNTLHADGSVVDPSRVEKVLNRDFTARSVVKNCVNSNSSTDVFEFQSMCDITPAIFDSSGLSMAHSVPVVDDTGSRIGVVSTRMRFERISHLIARRTFAQGRGVAHLITDAGTFFDEGINAGAVPPVPAIELKPLITPILRGETQSVSFERNGVYHAVFRMVGVSTLDQGGIQTMISVPASWVNRERLLSLGIAIGTPFSLTLLILLLRAVVRSGQESSRQADRALAAIRENEALRSTLQRHSIYSVADSQGRIVDFNENFCDVTGYSRSELLGKNHKCLTSGVHPPEFWKNMWRTLAAGGAWRGEICNRAKDGTLIWLDTIIAPFRDAEGAIEKYVSIRSDITARKIAEKEAVGARDFMHSAINALDSQTVVLDSSGYICAYNDAWASVADRGGGDPTTVLNGANYLRECDRAATHCDEARAVGDAIRRVIERNERPAAIEYACHTPSGHHWYMCSVRGFTNQGQRFVAVTHSEITSLKLAEANLRAANADLRTAKRLAQSADKAKSDFLANMSHEIRTPLTAIMGYADLLCENASDDAQSGFSRIESAQIIRRAGAHLLAVINDILDLSKIDSDNVTLEHIPSPTVEIIQEVAELVRIKAEAKSVKFTTSLDSPIPSLIYGDPTRLRQIIMNLAGNAVKFTETGVVSICARVDESASQARFVVDVLDTGPGMTTEQAARIFKPFAQGDSTVTRRHGGTGLGLAISRKLAQLMKGDVELVRSDASGSCFRLWIPIDPVPDATLVTMLGAPLPTAPSIERPAPAATTKTASTLGGARILLAEDGIDNQRLIAHLLRSGGFNVELADNGRIALEMIEARQESGAPFDLILTDMQMPVMDGYALTAALRNRGYTTPIIALTAHAMSGDRDRCAAAGCDDYATKPIEKHRLLATCRKWLKTAPLQATVTREAA